MARIERDRRTIHDQIIDHDLTGLPQEKMMALLIIEVRRMREQIVEVVEAIEPRRNPLWEEYNAYCIATGPQAVSYPRWLNTRGTG